MPHFVAFCCAGALPIALCCVFRCLFARVLLICTISGGTFWCNQHACCGHMPVVYFWTEIYFCICSFVVHLLFPSGNNSWDWHAGREAQLWKLAGELVAACNCIPASFVLRAGPSFSICGYLGTGSSRKRVPTVIGVSWRHVYHEYMLDTYTTQKHAARAHFQMR